MVYGGIVFLNMFKKRQKAITRLSKICPTVILKSLVEMAWWGVQVYFETYVISELTLFDIGLILLVDSRI